MKRCAVLALSAALLLGFAGSTLADGDPASDVLLGKNVFLPYPPPSRQGAAALEAQVAAVYAKRERIKVALIATRTDLGAIPSLFGEPAQYAVNAPMSFRAAGILTGLCRCAIARSVARRNGERSPRENPPPD